jgi:hypothetical protein
MNKKLFVLSLMVVSLLVMAVPTVFADTNVTMTGTGTIDFDTSILYDDDALAIFNFTGYGSFTLVGIETDNTAYPYMGVDTTSTYVMSDITAGGGFIQFEVQRLDSYGGYGAPGQDSYSLVYSSDGTASLDFKTTTNFADLWSSNWGFQANQQFEVSGSTIQVIHTLLTGSPMEGGQLSLLGSGTASIDYMADGYTDYNEFRFGYGDGCYENADLTANGAGVLTIGGVADNNIWAHDGSWSVSGSGGVGHTETWNYNGLLNVDDYAFGGN